MSSASLTSQARGVAVKRNQDGQWDVQSHHRAERRTRSLGGTPRPNSVRFHRRCLFTESSEEGRGTGCSGMKGTMQLGRDNPSILDLQA